MDDMETYLFLDRRLLNGCRCGNAVLKLETLHKENRILFREDYFSEPPRPWEVRYDNSYPNVIYDREAKLFRCYYTLFTHDRDSMETPLLRRASKRYRPGADRITSLCYAQSEDGVNWEKPVLGLVSFQGSAENNILLRYAHGTGVFLDEEETDRKKRYKLITKIDYSANNKYMAVGFSEDGIHFGKLQPWPKYNPKADTHNFAFRDRKTGKFVLITRMFRDGVRVPAICVSDDFINWSDAEEMTRGRGFEEQIYSMPVFQYNNLYLGLASVYHGGDYTARNFDRVDLKLYYATELSGWNEVCPEECLIERGAGEYPDGAFDSGCIFAAPPIERDGKLWIYYMGGNGPHSDYRETSFARGFLEKDRFAYYETKNRDQEGILYTAVFHVCGEGLEFLADVEKDGYVIPEFLDPKSGERIVDLKELTGKDAVLRIRFKGAKLYGMRACFAF